MGFPYINTNSSINDYNLILKKWTQQQNIPTNIIVDVSNLVYDNKGKIYRDILINEYGWYFNGDIQGITENQCVRYAKPIPLLFNSHTNTKQKSYKMRLASRLRYNKNIR
jgi:hypothetical protein